MEEYKRITDEEVFKAIKGIKNDDEQAMKNAIETLLLVSLDIRQFLRKVYKNMPKKVKTYKRPTGRKEDVITGEK